MPYKWSPNLCMPPVLLTYMLSSAFSGTCRVQLIMACSLSPPLRWIFWWLSATLIGLVVPTLVALLRGLLSFSAPISFHGKPKNNPLSLTLPPRPNTTLLHTRLQRFSGCISCFWILVCWSRFLLDSFVIMFLPLILPPIPFYTIVVSILKWIIILFGIWSPPSTSRFASSLLSLKSPTSSQRVSPHRSFSNSRPISPWFHPVQIEGV